MVVAAASSVRYTLGYYARAASAAIGRIRVHTGVRRAKGLFDPVHIFDHVVTRGAHFHGLFVLQFLRLQATHIGVHFRELGFHSLLGQARKLLSSPSYEMVRRLGWSMWHTATHRRWYPRPCGDTKGGSYSCCCGSREVDLFRRFSQKSFHLFFCWTFFALNTLIKFYKVKFLT